MKKFIIYILWFFAIVAIIDFGLGKAFDYMTLHAKGGANKQLIDLCKHVHYDMLIMGSSKAHHNYIPQVFSDSLGLFCYNAGYDGNGIILAYGLLSMIDDERLPKMIIYDVKQQFDIYKYQGDGDYTRYFQQLRKFYGNQLIDSIIGSISRQDLIKLGSGLVRYNGDLLLVVSGFLRGSSVDNNYGYVPSIGQLKEDITHEKDYSEQIDELKLTYFRKFINLNKEKGIKLIVVLSPEYKTPFSDDFNPVRAICDTEGIPVIDYFDEPSFQKIGYFKDHCHLNEAGASVFSKRMVSVIQSNKFQ